MKDTKSRFDSARLHLATIEDLVDEMIKPKPAEARIKECMKQVGLNYSNDPIKRISTVLEALDRSSTQNEAPVAGRALAARLKDL